MQSINKINLTKLRKCDQTWENMTPNEQGRICKKCQHTIIDFRDLTDQDIAETHTFSSGKICGLYHQKQLQLPTKKPQSRKRIKSIYIGMLGFISTITSNAQTAINTEKTVQTAIDYTPQTISQKVTIQQVSAIKDSLIIYGVLKDENEEPIIFAIIHIKDTKTGTITDIDGNYRLNVTEALDSLEQITLAFSYIGYTTEEVTIDKSDFLTEKTKQIDVRFKESSEITEFYISTEKQPWYKRFWNKVRNTFRRKK